ncbi:MAG: glutamine synthetase, partial [SAR202 cluster bacterium]|nr:glutamine synthetase [SAR202 cluster bacterium]
MVYKAEYLWLDGSQPSARLRSKTKIVPDGEEPPIWGYDGSSTQQASGNNSDVVLRPVLTVPDPLRGENNVIVMCETLLTDMSPHPSNTRAACEEAAAKYRSFDTWFGIEQEYTFFQGNAPLGWPENGFPAPQGDYYCGVGSDVIFGRDIVEDHMDACIEAGLH